MVYKSYLFPLYILTVVVLLLACDSNTDDANTSGDSPSNEALVDATLAALNKAIIERPNDAQVFADRANYYREQNNFTLALDDFNRALKIDSLNSTLVYERGELYFAFQQFDLARADYEKCISISPTSTDCLLKLGEIQIHLRNYMRAIELINDALRENEQLPYAYYMKGRIYKETGDTLLAASSYQTAIEVSPDYYDAYIEIGLLYTAAKSDLAIEYFKTALEIRPKSVEAMYNLAYFYQITGSKEKKRYQEAFALYDRILAEDPGNATSPYNKGFIHLEYLQNYDSAAFYFAEASKLYPGYYQAYYNRGLALESLGKTEEALKEYNRSLSIQPDFTPAAIAKGRVLGE
jgi:tetratricopeptide (TPR) repeat protein